MKMFSVGYLSGHATGIILGMLCIILLGFPGGVITAVLGWIASLVTLYLKDRRG